MLKSGQNCQKNRIGQNCTKSRKFGFFESLTLFNSAVIILLCDSVVPLLLLQNSFATVTNVMFVVADGSLGVVSDKKKNVFYYCWLLFLQFLLLAVVLVFYYYCSCCLFAYDVGSLLVLVYALC